VKPEIILAVIACLACLALVAHAEQIVATAVGAVPGDGKDDTAALQAALDKVSGKKNVQVVFPKGKYDFFAGQNVKNKHHALVFSDIDGLTIAGNGSEFLFHGLLAGFSIYKCKNVTLQGFVMDWPRPSFSVGEVVASQGRSFDVKVWDEFPVKGGDPVEAYMEYDPITKLPLKRGLDVYAAVDSTSLVSPQVLRVMLKRNIPMKPGNLVILRHQVYSFNAVDFSESFSVAVKDVTIYTAPGMGVVGQFTTDITLDKLRVIPKPGTRRIMSTTADATHFNCCYGSVSIQDCEFEGMGDDAVNIHGMYHLIDKVVDASTVETHCRNNWVLPPRPGDKMEFTHSDTLQSFAEGVVKSVTVKDKSHTIVFAGPIPQDCKPGDALGNASWAPKTRIKGCTVKNNRARGMLIQTRDVILEKCRFDGCSAGALNISCDLDYWLESIATRNVVIRDNVFENCNFGAAMFKSVINIFADCKGGKRPQAGVHQKILIEKNTIRDTDNAAIFISSADGVDVRNNRFENVSKDPAHTEGRSVIFIENAKNVSITRNTFVPAEGRKAEVTSGPGSDTNTITVKDNKGL